jgi:hypothetical protein
MWAAAAGGVAAGMAGMYAAGVMKGYFPIAFGPEDPRWSKEEWSSAPQAKQELAKLDAAHSGFVRHLGKSSTRNFLTVTASTPERRVMRKSFWNEEEKRLVSPSFHPFCLHWMRVASYDDGWNPSSS